jgi:hypothetical protein
MAVMSEQTNRKQVSDFICNSPNFGIVRFLVRYSIGLPEKCRALLPIVLIPGQGVPIGGVGGRRVVAATATASVTTGGQSRGQAGNPNDSPKRFPSKKP